MAKKCLRTGLDRPRQVLFSEIKMGSHMGIVAAEESRMGERDVYVPAHEHGMAHRSYLSPDGKWVLLVEMDQDHLWLPCRVVPMDGRLDGPPGGAPWRRLHRRAPGRPMANGCI